MNSVPEALLDPASYGPPVVLETEPVLRLRSEPILIIGTNRIARTTAVCGAAGATDETR